LGASFGLAARINLAPPQTGGRKDPFLSYNFAVEIEGLVVGGFNEVTGLQAEIEVHEYREGGLNEYMLKRAGPVKYPPLVLKKGITDQRSLWDWYKQVMTGTIERKNVSVLLLDSTGQERLRWNFEKAYPMKWDGPNLRGNANEIAVESIELAHNGLS
jgi:phage tail-like protein